MYKTLARSSLILLLSLVVFPFGVGCGAADGTLGGACLAGDKCNDDLVCNTDTNICEEGEADGDGDGEGEGEGEGEGLPPAEQSFSAALASENEVADEPVVSDATGTAAFQLIEEGTRFAYTINVSNGVGITQAHIHVGGLDENGDVVAFLFGPADQPLDVDGELVVGTVSGDDLVGPLEGMPFSALLEQVEAGNTYVNVHTEANPAGEVRGQISLDEDLLSQTSDP